MAISADRKILVTGATGYIGGRLVPRLIDSGYSVRCLARNAARLDGRFPKAEVLEGEIFKDDDLRAACDGIDTAYYLVHAMGDSHDFASRDRDAAERFARVARECGIRRIVYLGGLGDDGAQLSRHLRSRHEVGDVLRSSGIETIELRAAMIIGSGSISFEMMRYLTERLPVMIAPRWVTTRSQPIGIRDVLAYLVAALELHEGQPRVYEIGGADVLTYRDMMLRYAKLRDLHRKVVVVPFFTPRLSSYWVHLITPISARLAQPLILGLHNEVIVRDGAAERDFPQIRPEGFDAAVLRALDRYRATGLETTWFDAFDVRHLPPNFSGVREGILIDRRECVADATPNEVASVFTQLGGKRGWLYGDRLWKLRGLMDRAVGGIGIRRGRRSATELRLGDAVDFWRVDAYEPNRKLRLRAEMKLPGIAWLEFETEGLSNGRAKLMQTAFFEPRGLFGFLYWYGVMPFHAVLFGRMAAAIANAAHERACKGA